MPFFDKLPQKKWFVVRLGFFKVCFVLFKKTEGRGFESHLGLGFFLCPLMVDSLHLPLFPLQFFLAG